MFRREQQLAMYAKKRKSIVRPVIRAQERLERMSKKRAYKSGSEPTRYILLIPKINLTHNNSLYKFSKSTNAMV